MESSEGAALPIAPLLPRIASIVKTSGALVLSAEPGAGKTSLVPSALAEALGGKVLVMEPRRVAAASAAARIAELWGKRLGDDVGYRVRGESRSSPRAIVEAVTPGVLLRMIQGDPGLERCACVVLDEFHERSAQSDLVLALLRQVRALRPELCLVAMSATMDLEKAAVALGARILEVPGRTFPIETRYVPAQQGRGFEEAIARLTLEAMDEAGGDVLAFLPGAAEINRAAAEFSRLAASRPGVDRPAAAVLHGSLGLDAQRRIICPWPKDPRRAIFSTSVAESSLTVPRVRAVIDSGLARLSRFQARTGLNRLVTERESGDQADQRRGRAGRLGPGLCIRAWNEHEVLPERTEPELSRAELSGIVLEAALWGAPERLDLEWLDPPPEAAWKAGTELLIEFGALSSELLPTAFGKKMAALGTEPRIAALVIKGKEFGSGWEACLAAAILSERSPAGTNDIAGRIAEMLAASGALRGESTAVLAEARRLAAAAGIAVGGDETQKPSSRALSLGSLLATAFPDRIGERVEIEAGKARFRLPSGRMLAASGELALSPWALALEADAGAAEGKIYSGYALGESEALAALEAQAKDETEAEWKGLSLKSSKVRRAGAIVLSRHPAPSLGRVELAQLLADRIASEGLGFLPWEGGAREELDRLRFFATRRPEIALKRGLDPEAIGDASLAAAVASWLGPFLRESGGPILDGPSFARAVAALAPAALRQDLEREAPRRFELPSGSSKPISYGGPGGASVEARVQEFFGLSEQPRACGEAIALKLLDPGGKSFQVTSDLPGFWRGSWAEARKDLRGRYPKHEWPEDPANAVPSRSGMKRKTK
jgi:ATP-dependent helicase HrpB